jgi:hypothetical protein
MARKPHLRERKITVDMSEWELGDWPEKIEEAITIDRIGGKLIIKIGDKQFEDAAREIAEDAVKAFFEQELFFHCMAAGIVQSDLEGTTTLMIPWNDIWLMHHHEPGRTTLRAALQWMIDGLRDATLEGEEELRDEVAAILDEALKKCGDKP